MYFQKPGRISKNSKNLEEIQKTWRKFPKKLWPPCEIHHIVDGHVLGSSINFKTAKIISALLMIATAFILYKL